MLRLEDSHNTKKEIRVAFRRFKVARESTKLTRLDFTMIVRAHSYALR